MTLILGSVMIQLLISPKWQNPRVFAPGHDPYQRTGKSIHSILSPGDGPGEGWDLKTDLRSSLRQFTACVGDDPAVRADPQVKLPGDVKSSRQRRGSDKNQGSIYSRPSRGLWEKNEPCPLTQLEALGPPGAYYRRNFTHEFHSERIRNRR